MVNKYQSSLKISTETPDLKWNTFIIFHKFNFFFSQDAIFELFKLKLFEQIEYIKDNIKDYCL